MTQYNEKMDILTYMVENGLVVATDLDSICNSLTLEQVKGLCKALMGDVFDEE